MLWTNTSILYDSQREKLRIGVRRSGDWNTYKWHKKYKINDAWNQCFESSDLKIYQSMILLTKIDKL